MTQQINSVATVFRQRRLVLLMATAGLLSAIAHPALARAASSVWVHNASQLYPVQVARIVKPNNQAELLAILKNWPGQLSVAGAGFSMGGQIAVQDGLHLDMSAMNRLISFSPEDKRIRVQAGMRWRELQEIIDPHDLAVTTMQSYANFSIGGSVSVNAHGRYVGHGALANTVLALQLVLADGSVIECSPQQHRELFRAVIGGYAALALITEVELRLTENCKIERQVKKLNLSNYPEYFAKEILAKPDCVLHNADFFPPHYDVLSAVSWWRTDKPLNNTQRLRKHGEAHRLEKKLAWALTELPGGLWLRPALIEPLRYAQQAVQWLNYEASRDVAELEPDSRRHSSYILQEYFIPTRHFSAFAQGLIKLLQAYQVQALNISIRHAPADTLSLMPWAKEEVFAFVLFYKQATDTKAQQQVGVWTRALIELALSVEGRYYLPYQLHASQAQFAAAYPEAEQLRALKARYDPTNRFSNEMWRKYL